MVAAAIAIGSAVAGAGSQLIGGQTASSAAKNAANEQLQMYGMTEANLAPYNTLGQSAGTAALNLALGSPTGGGPDYISQAGANLPGTMTQAQLEQTPGYQFDRAQGLKAVQSAAAARGLGVSGSSIKGAATYATGLADSTYSTQFANAQSRFTDYLNLNTGQQTNLQNQATRLNALTGVGENAAAATGYQGTMAAGNYGNYLNASGQAAGAGVASAGNALSSGVNNLLGYNLAQQYLNPNTAQGATTQSINQGYSAPSQFSNQWDLSG